uniref:Putative secreted protein n=1 Tax=Anopheles darlingi TaxID=43151 RepID=A0A2M4DGS6_ANODA
MLVWPFLFLVLHPFPCHIRGGGWKGINALAIVHPRRLLASELSQLERALRLRWIQSYGQLDERFVQ